jgi:hypothetical protein
LEEAVGLAAALGLPGQEASGLDFLAKLASWSGDGEAAERLHERALAAAAAAKDPRALSYGEIGRAATRLRLGDVEGARAALAAAEGHGIAEDDATAVAEWATCRLRAGAGDPDEVRRRIENAGDGLAVATRIELLHDLWRVTGEPRDLDAAWGQLEDLARHAPSPDAVWAGTPIHRALASARLRGAVDETSDG